MKRYELIITRTQPPCGGKAPKVFDFLNVETDEPIAYVRKKEPEAVLDVLEDTPEHTVIIFSKGAQQVTYEFTED